jgi:hypothetical protein
MTSSQSAGRLRGSALVPRSTTSTPTFRAHASITSSSGSHSPDGFASTPTRVSPLVERNVNGSIVRETDPDCRRVSGDRRVTFRGRPLPEIERIGLAGLDERDP